MSLRNYPLYIGSFLCALLLAVAVFGPALAPYNPMKADATIFVDGRVYGAAPLRALGPFITNEYPLGIDNAGRDVLSRLLWAVRPTLILCAVIVAVRLLVGVVVGLVTGWFTGPIPRGIEALIILAGALPPLVVAVVGLLAIGIEQGLPAFIVALSITGWSNMAALVKSRTETIRQAPYIEAARAVGCTPAGILWRHALPQLWVVLPMLIAFDLTAVLLIVAELGYIGFFIGGGFVYEGGADVSFRAASEPELGQMLSQFFGLLNRTPWVGVFAGIMVFLALSGFTLLGEGLRRRLDVTRPRRRHIWRRGKEDEPAGVPRLRWSAAFVLAVVVIIVGVVLRNRDNSAALPTTSGPQGGLSTQPVSGDQLAALDLQGVAFQPGDLPDAYSLAGISSNVPAGIRGIPTPLNVFSFDLDRDGLNNGSVTILLYDSLSNRDAAYESLVENNPSRVIGGPSAPASDSASVPVQPSLPAFVIGNRAHVIQDLLLFDAGNPTVYTRGVVFARCAAVVLIEVGSPSSSTSNAASPPLAVDYAQKLDTRLTPLVCQLEEITETSQR